MFLGELISLSKKAREKADERSAWSEGGNAKSRSGSLCDEELNIEGADAVSEGGYRGARGLPREQMCDPGINVELDIDDFDNVELPTSNAK